MAKPLSETAVGLRTPFAETVLKQAEMLANEIASGAVKR